jgi:hypothetical protein
MRELELCIKSLSYPLGMLIEGKELRDGDVVSMRGNTLTIPPGPFGGRCILTAEFLFRSLDVVDRKRLGDDYRRIEKFRDKLLSSTLGDSIREYVEEPWRKMIIGNLLSIDWLEFDRRTRRIEGHLKRLKELLGLERREFLESTSFLGELSVDECLLLND